MVDIAAPGADVLPEVDDSMLPNSQNLISYANIMRKVYDYSIKIKH
jgi:hypothetical protein